MLEGVFCKNINFEANVDISENRVPNTVELPGATRGQVRNIKILDAAEAAAIMRMDSRTLIRWARLGYVPAHPLGEGKRRLWRFIEDMTIVEHHLKDLVTRVQPVTLDDIDDDLNGTEGGQGDE